MSQTTKQSRIKQNKEEGKGERGGIKGIRWELVVVKNAKKNIKERGETGVHGSNRVLRIKGKVIFVEPHLGNIQKVGLRDALYVYLHLHQS